MSSALGSKGFILVRRPSSIDFRAVLPSCSLSVDNYFLSDDLSLTDIDDAAILFILYILPALPVTVPPLEIWTPPDPPLLGFNTASWFCKSL